LGVATGLLWVPCAGPVLGLILTGAATSLALALLVGGKVFAAMKRTLGMSEWMRRGMGALVLVAVVSGRTGHAEAVQVTFDPQVISYGEILQIYFSVAHDPTQLNCQGPDRGTQYRSAIFPQNAEQAQIASAYIDQLNAAKTWRAAIVTTIEADKPFYAAEDYHQDYMTKHPTQPYIVINDLPKVDNLKQLFPQRFRNMPRLVAHTGN